MVEGAGPLPRKKNHFFCFQNDKFGCILPVFYRRKRTRWTVTRSLETQKSTKIIQKVMVRPKGGGRHCLPPEYATGYDYLNSSNSVGGNNNAKTESSYFRISTFHDTHTRRRRCSAL